MDSEELLIVLLTGGGLALLGTVLGALITQVFAIRLGREARRDERRLAIKSFQRDTLVSLQDSVVDAMDAWVVARRSAMEDRADKLSTRERYSAAQQRVRMFASRVRDDELRSAVREFLNDLQRLLDEGGDSGTAQRIVQSFPMVWDRTGELIRTLDAIEDESVAPSPSKSRLR